MFWFDLERKKEKELISEVSEIRYKPWMQGWNFSMQFNNSFNDKFTNKPVDEKYNKYLQEKAKIREEEKAKIREEKIKSLQKKYKVWTEVYRKDNDEGNKFEEWFIIQILDLEEYKCSPFAKSELNLKVLVKTTEWFFKEDVSDLIIKEEIKKSKKK